MRRSREILLGMLGCAIGMGGASLFATFMIRGCIEENDFGRNPPESERVAAKARGDLLIRALEQFRAEKGKYPNALNQLVPTYCPEIPSRVSDLGHEFVYRKEEDGFVLSFWLCFSLGYEWRSEAPGWKTLTD